MQEELLKIEREKLCRVMQDEVSVFRLDVYFTLNKLLLDCLRHFDTFWPFSR